jgi:hypothetical protein
MVEVSNTLAHTTAVLLKIVLRMKTLLPRANINKGKNGAKSKALFSIDRQFILEPANGQSRTTERGSTRILKPCFG